jgi:hypothetical protein
MPQSIKRITVINVAASMTLSSNRPWAQTPNDLSDLVDAHGRDAESQMEGHGYVSHHTSKSSDAAYTHWWNSRDKRCVRVRARDGRYEQIKTVGNSDCDQRDNSGSKAAAVAVGAAALLGLAVLASRSHHREDRDLDERQTAQFERGYRDVLHNQPFHNYEKSNEYSDGYRRWRSGAAGSCRQSGSAGRDPKERAHGWLEGRPATRSALPCPATAAVPAGSAARSCWYSKEELIRCVRC